jgi:hypothetical protein
LNRRLTPTPDFAGAGKRYDEEEYVAMWIIGKLLS